MDHTWISDVESLAFQCLLLIPIPLYFLFLFFLCCLFLFIFDVLLFSSKTCATLMQNPRKLNLWFRRIMSARKPCLVPCSWLSCARAVGAPLPGRREFCCRRGEDGSIDTAHARFASVFAPLNLDLLCPVGDASDVLRRSGLVSNSHNLLHCGDPVAPSSTPSALPTRTSFPVDV